MERQPQSEDDCRCDIIIINRRRDRRAGLRVSIYPVTSPLARAQSINMSEEAKPENQRSVPDPTWTAKVLEEIEKRSRLSSLQGFEYEKLAIEYSHRGFQALTYLNGGALVAIPTALAFFKADPQRSSIVITAAAFIAGLVFVVIAQGCAFFVMARRSEAMACFRDEQTYAAIALNAPPDTPMQNLEASKSTDSHREAVRRQASSDRWRIAGLAFFALSLVLFVTGCVVGADAVLNAKLTGIIASD